MKVIVGLGNPGVKYENTKHNVGFMLVDHLASQIQLEVDKEKFQGIYGIGTYQGEKILLLKPLTYMNLSGESLRAVIDFYKIDPKDIMVVYDDLDLPVGKIRLRMKGSAGGHNGIKSIIAHLGTQEFNRIRIGIGRPENGMSITDYVLSDFSKEDNEKIKEMISQAKKACIKWIDTPFLEVMNEFNQ